MDKNCVKIQLQFFKTVVKTSKRFLGVSFFFAVSREATPRKEESFLMQLDANTHFTHLHILMNCIFDYKEECISLKKVESHYAFWRKIRVDTPFRLLAEMRQSGNRSFMQGS